MAAGRDDLPARFVRHVPEHEPVDWHHLAQVETRLLFEQGVWFPPAEAAAPAWAKPLAPPASFLPVNRPK